MPRLAHNGYVACGVAGVQGSVNGDSIPNSYGGYFYNDLTLVFTEPSSNFLIIYDLNNHSRIPVYPVGPNKIAANGGVWAAWIDPVTGLVSSNGVNLPLAGLLNVGPDGAIGYTVNRGNDVFGCEAVEVNGEVWKISDNPILSLQLLGARRAIWQDYGFGLHTLNLPSCTRVPGNFWNPSACEINGEWWVSYFSQNYGYVLHPFNSTVGYVIQPNTNPVYAPTMITLNGMIRTCWSVTEGEGPNDWRIRDVNVATEPRQQIVAQPSIPAIGKPCWVSWFEFNRPPAMYPPGNALLKIRYEDANAITSKEGVRFGEWVEGHTVEELEAKCTASQYQCIAYWDGRDWPRWPNIKPNDWIGLQAYCSVNESPEQFEGSMRSMISSVPGGHKVALICQCYTSNAALTTNLSGLVPVFARLARDFARVTHLAVFSDQDRATGLNDHPELRPLWQELFNSITGEPPMSTDPDILPENIYKTLQEIRHKWPTPMGNRAAEMLNEAAWIHRAEGWGLEFKGGGNVCPQPKTDTTCGCDILRLTNSGYDCLLDAEGEATPTRGARGDADPNRYVPAVEPETPPVSEVYVGILDYDKVFSRSNPNGLLVRFDCGSPNPIVMIELELLNDGEPAIQINFSDEPRVDGRYVRALAFKPTVNGHWTLRVTAWDNAGNTSFADGPIPVEVTF